MRDYKFENQITEEEKERLEKFGYPESLYNYSRKGGGLGLCGIKQNAVKKISKKAEKIARKIDADAIEFDPFYIKHFFGKGISGTTYAFANIQFYREEGNDNKIKYLNPAVYIGNLPEPVDYQLDEIDKRRVEGICEHKIAWGDEWKTKPQSEVNFLKNSIKEGDKANTDLILIRDIDFEYEKQSSILGLAGFRDKGVTSGDVYFYKIKSN